MPKKLVMLNLSLFDGDAAPAAESSESGEAATQASTEVSTPNMVSGQDQPQGEVTNPQTPMSFKEMLESNPEYKNEYEKTIQNRVARTNARANKEKQSLQTQLDKQALILNELCVRYGVQGGDLETLQQKINSDTSYLEYEADERGMTVEQLQYEKQLLAQNQRLQQQQQYYQAEQQRQMQFAKWDSESAELQTVYPNFNFIEEMETNEVFNQLIRSNFPMKDAYEFAHKDEISAAREAAAVEAYKKQSAANTKAGRAAEAGTRTALSTGYKVDPSKATKAQMEEWRQMILRGEKLPF